MNHRPKPSGITLFDLNNAFAEAHITPQPKESRKYWAIKRQLEWEHRQKVLAGHARARKEGKRIGRPPVMTLAESIGKMRDTGVTWERIAKHFNRPISTMFRHYDMYLREKGLPGASRQRLK